ncbi:Thioredoxin [Fodinibius salinus]|uniref:Thioredoxin n=1 Tax=Fodinibius salinus TaxID=860790 RepID=A0A5D3YHQ0_9BACT|nr:thioredoxin family protein [Fodinibius salinus]TYP92739.1 Thioredoxin [Fodinibius salinus]
MSTTTKQVINQSIIDNAMTYGQYRQMIDELVNKNETTGDDHSEEMIEYTKMNVQRMDRLDKQIELADSLVEKLNQLDESWVWLILTEAWCGDAAQNVPIIAKIADQTENIELRLILRDQHLNIIDEYLTDGGRSIPKLVCLDAETLQEIGTWGPRPGDFQKKAMEWKNDSDISKEEWAEKLHKWYAKNKGQELMADFEELLNQWSTNDR